MQHDHEPSGGYERTDAQFKPIAIFAAVLTLVVLSAFVSMKWVFDAFDARETRADQAPHRLAQPTEPPAPRLQRETSADWIAHQARERVLTTQYAWIDRSAGLVRIPVERAMELTLERGLPTRGAKK